MKKYKKINFYKLGLNSNINKYKQKTVKIGTYKKNVYDFKTCK